MGPQTSAVFPGGDRVQSDQPYTVILYGKAYIGVFAGRQPSRQIGVFRKSRREMVFLVMVAGHQKNRHVQGRQQLLGQVVTSRFPVIGNIPGDDNDIGDWVQKLDVTDDFPQQASSVGSPVSPFAIGL